MKLPFFNRPSNEGKTFFGLFLKEEKGIGLVMRMENSHVVLLDQEKFSYPDGWEHLTEAVDEVLLKLEQRTKVKLDDTIFFIYSHFIDEKTKEIKKVYLDKIKDLVKKLNLKALGYIESYEAVINYLQKKEELPLTAILIELDHSNLSVFIYKRGELTYAKNLSHTDNLIDDLLMCFMEIKGRFLLPSRIILYNSKDLDNESTEIVTYRWSEELFVQLPRVEIVKEHEVIQGLIGVFANQYGQKVSEAAFTEQKSKEEVMGFVIGGDVEEKKTVPVKSQTAEKSAILPKISFEPLTKRLKNFGMFFKSAPKIFSKKWTILIGILLIITGILLNEYFIHKANLTLFLPSKAIKKEIELNSSDITFDTLEKTVKLIDTKSTTGKKEIGEKAHGSVTVHNFDDNEKTFSKGTSLETSGLKFSLDQDVKIASASVVTINGGVVKQPGKAKVNVTADQIGPQGNVSSGKQFKIGDFPTSLYFGLNDSAFAGGSKKEIKTAAKKDLEDLRKSIEAQAKKQKIDLSEDKKSTDSRILNQLTEVVITDEKFDKEVGEEAYAIKLEAKVKIKVYTYKDKALSDVVVKNLAADSEKGFELKKDKLSYSIKDAVKKAGEITIRVDAVGNSIKDIASSEVITIVKGKNRDNIEKLMKDKYEIQGFQLEIEPNIPILKNYLPFFAKNISLKLSSL